MFITVLSKSGGTVSFQSGGNAVFTRTVEPGVTAFSVPMGVGKQRVALQAAGRTVEATSDVDISDQCWVSCKAGV